MELRQLRAFVEVATLRHFGHAAERLHLTQPALTQRIQALERELGLQLLERNAREVRLAPPGIVLLPHARRLIQAEDLAVRDLTGYTSGTLGRLQIAYQSAGDTATTGAIIAEYRRRFPGVEVDTVSGSSGPNLQLVQDFAADAAFALLSSSRPDGIAARTIRREEVVLAMRSDHRLASMDPIPIKELRDEPLSMPPSAANPHLIAALRRWLVRHVGAELNIVSEEPTDLAQQTVAKAGLAVVLVIRRYVAMQPVEGIAYRSISPAPLVELAIAHRREDPSPTLANLIRLVDEMSKQSYAIPEDGELI
jgi:DNA-binding transcriptional LysR family regulator